MNNNIYDLLHSVTHGEKLEYKNMTVFPLFTAGNDKLDYLTMKEAMEGDLLIIEEVSSGGSVPELRAVNKSEKPVLLLDGEEIIGAKQNRILNTSVLLPENSSVEINVSCTEQGRWSYRTEHFQDSNEVITKDVRAMKMSSVSANLSMGAGFYSDQGEVWDEIASKQESANVYSDTHAMKDVYEAKKNELNDYLEQFPIQKDQAGLLVFIDGKAAGMDMVSLQKAYKIYHGKMVRSYAMEASLSRRPANKPVSAETANGFISHLENCSEHKHKSIGLGWDFRYEGTNIVGSALIYNDTVVHTAFFSLGNERTDEMRGFRQRRNYRR
jgi:hypothetical protein